MLWSLNCTLLVKFPRSLHDISPSIALNQCHSSIRKLGVEAIRIPLVRYAVLTNQYTVSFFVIPFRNEFLILRVHYGKGKCRFRTKNTVFFNYLLPVIEQKNAEILKLRALISNDELSAVELEKLALKYRLDRGVSKEDMLIAIDILPPSLILAQAANESNWGRSRFAEDYNNYFGIWCFSKGCGTVPKNRDEDATHEVATFSSLRDSIDYYVLNLNRNQAYHNLRAIRKEQRDNGSFITGLALAKGLTPYAQTGDIYVASIQSLISYNKLEQYDL